MQTQVKAYDQGEWAVFTLYADGTFARAWRSTPLTESLGLPTVEQAPLPIACMPLLGGPLHYDGQVYRWATGSNVHD